MKKTLEFDPPEGCDEIAFGRDLNEKGIKREACEAHLYRIDPIDGQREWVPGTIKAGDFKDALIYAYRLKPVAQAEEQDGILVRGIPPLPVGMTECGMGSKFPQFCTAYRYRDFEWVPVVEGEIISAHNLYAWTTTPKPDTVTVEVELPSPAEGKKWRQGQPEDMGGWLRVEFWKEAA